MRYLVTHLDKAWMLTVIHLRLSLIPVVLGLLIAVPLGAYVWRTTALRRLTTVTPASSSPSRHWRCSWCCP